MYTQFYFPFSGRLSYFVYLCESASLSVLLCLFLSVCQSVCPALFLSVCHSGCPGLSISVSLPVCLSCSVYFCQSANLSVILYLSVCQSVCLSYTLCIVFSSLLHLASTLRFCIQDEIKWKTTTTTTKNLGNLSLTYINLQFIPAPTAAFIKGKERMS